MIVVAGTLVVIVLVQTGDTDRLDARVQERDNAEPNGSDDCAVVDELKSQTLPWFGRATDDQFRNAGVGHCLLLGWYGSAATHVGALAVVRL